MSAAWIILKKELRDNLRDRRSLGMAMLFPVLSPLIVGFAVWTGAKHEIREATEPFAIAVKGAEHAPHLIAHLKGHGAKVEPAPENLEDAVQKRTFDVALVIEPDFAESVHAGRRALVTMIGDDARSDSMKAQRRTRAIVQQFGSTIGVVRLMARGVDPTLLNAVTLEERDISTPESRAALFLLGLPLMLAIAAFIGGLYVAIDVTAGEKERGSLEALALNPIPRAAIGLGKLAAVCVFAAGSLAASGVGFALVPMLVPSDVMEIPIDPFTILRLVLVCLPLVLLASVLQVFVATRAKGFKEAQASLSYISLLPTLPGMMLTATQNSASLAWSWIPIYGQQLLMGRWLRGESVGLMALAPTLTTIAMSMLLAWFALRRYEDERMYLA